MVIRHNANDQASRTTSTVPDSERDPVTQRRYVKTIWTVPNILSLSRLLICLPVLWLIAIYGQPVWLGILLAVALLTDLLDGNLARRLHQVTALGSRLDSIADSGLLGSGVVWLLMLRPEVAHGRYAVILVLSVALWAVATVIAKVRFQRFANLHLYSGKAATTVGGLFLVDAFLLGFHPWFFYLTAGVCAVANAESTVLLSTRKHVDEHIGSIFGRAGKKGHAHVSGAQIIRIGASHVRDK